MQDAADRGIPWDRIRRLINNEQTAVVIRTLMAFRVPIAYAFQTPGSVVCV
jgi:hypothetical protein